MRRSVFRVIDTLIYKLESELNKVLKSYKWCEVQSTITFPNNPNNITVILICEEV